LIASRFPLPASRFPRVGTEVWAIVTSYARTVSSGCGAA